MTLNAKIEVLWIFWRFWAARHVSRANCAEINWDRHGEAACEIFSSEHRFRRSSLDFLNSRKRADLHTKASKSHRLPLIGMGILPITTSTSDELFSCININDFERPWTSKIRDFKMRLFHHKKDRQTDRQTWTNSTKKEKTQSAADNIQCTMHKCNIIGTMNYCGPAYINDSLHCPLRNCEYAWQLSRAIARAGCFSRSLTSDIREPLTWIFARDLFLTSRRM